MIPATRANARGVAQAALHLVSERSRGDEFAPAGTEAFRDREGGRDIVARMRRFLRKVSIIVIEVANAAAVRESGPIGRRLVARPDNCRSLLRRKIRGDFARNLARFLIPGPEGAAD